MGAKGNTYWKQRLAHGRKHKIGTPTQLLNGAIEYFDFLEKNPLIEAKAFSFQGETHNHNLPKMRAPTLQGLWVHLNINKDTWYAMCNDRGKGFSEVCGWIDSVLYDWKFQGAAAGLLNHAIIARDLGLRDKHDVTSDDMAINNIVVSYD